MMAAVRHRIALAVGIALASAGAPRPAAAQARVVGLVVWLMAVSF